MGLLLVTGLSLSSSTALEWSTEGNHRWAKLADPGKGKPGFTLMPPKQTGVQFTNTLSTAILIGNKNLLNGSGVALGDYDGDGLFDIYLSRLEGDNAACGIACPSQFSTGSVFADVDGDHDLDLLVTAMGQPNRLFLNNGDSTFADATTTAGIGTRYGSNSIALADIDNDGDIDLYIVNYGAKSVLKDGGKLDIIRGTITRNKMRPHLCRKLSAQHLVAWNHWKSLVYPAQFSSIKQGVLKYVHCRIPPSWRLRLTCALWILKATGLSICSSRKTPSEYRSVALVMTAAGAFCCAAMARGTSQPCRLP